jgi:sugar-specific transcriptional regulator TrmB
MEIKDTLEKIGLRPAEIEVYINLLKLGETKVGEIVKISKISSSNVNDALNSLHKRGIIGFVVKNNLRHYYPIEVDSLNLLIEKQEEKINQNKIDLSKAIPELKAIKRIEELKQNAQIFTGITGVKSAFNELFKIIYKNQEYKFFYKYDKLNVDIVDKFFAKMDIEDYYKNIPTKGLFTNEYKKYFKQRHNKIKAKFTNNPIPSSINIYGDKTLILSWTENPIAILIQSKEITQNFEELFDAIWEKD